MALSALLVAGTPPASADPGPGDEGLDVSHFSFFERWGPGPYPLDPIPRFAEPGRRVRCDAGTMIRYRSPSLRYAVRAHPAFVERLRRFERLVSDLAVEHYGRAPRRLVHRGAFACRRARARRGRISEHAFGNAIDLRGLDFGRLPRGGEAPPDLPRHMRRAFRLRVLRHWAPRRARHAHHARFLHRLAESVRSDPHVFRGIVGPPRPRHADHLHLDAAPWQYAMFGYDRVGD